MELTPTSLPSGADDASGRPSPEAVRAQVEYMLSSPELHASRRRRTFLNYLVDETLAGRGEALKGYSIALAVFGRDAAFQPQSDPVVRLEARRLRRDLDSYYMGAGTRDPIRISIPKGGYIPHFEWREAPAGQTPAAPPAAIALPAASPPDIVPSPGAPAGSAPLSRRWRPAAAVLAVLAFAVILTIAISAWNRAARSPASADPPGIALIVLPFDSLSTREDDAFLAAGMTQELITDLMRFEGFRLYSVPASFRQDASAEPTEIGKSLGVAYVVKGSIRTDGGTTRIGAQLFDAGTGEVLWSETYDRQLTPGALLGVQNNLSASIASELGQSYGVVNMSASAELSAPVASDIAGYDCVLRAYQYRRTFDKALHGPVLACLGQLTRDDPGYAIAWAMLGWLHLDAARYGFVPAADAPGEMSQALAMTSKAVRIAPSSVMALQALSAVQYHLGRFDESERVQRRALALNPNDPDTLAQLGWRLALRGRWAEAMPYVNRAIARTISPPGWYYDMVSIRLYLDGEYRDMLASAELSSTGDPTGMSFLAIAQGALGDMAGARQSLDRMAALSPALARDPRRIYGNFQPTDEILNALMTGLRNAGWTPPP